MKVFYVAGPFTAPTDAERAHNIGFAQAMGAWLLGCGAAVIIPHSNTGLPPIYGNVSEDVCKEAAITLLSRCDAMVVLTGWQRSVGTRAEVEYAERNKMLVFHSFERDKIKRWIDANR